MVPLFRLMALLSYLIILLFCLVVLLSCLVILLSYLMALLFFLMMLPCCLVVLPGGAAVEALSPGVPKSSAPLRDYLWSEVSFLRPFWICGPVPEAGSENRVPKPSAGLP